MLALSFALPSLLVRILQIELAPEHAVVIFGSAIVASAVLLAWAAEAAQKDIPASLAFAILALIAVLPEYAVDLYFAYTAGHKPEYAQYAAANMTGSNRLLIGFGWPMVALIFAVAARRKKLASIVVHLEPNRRVEIAFLALASIYAFVIPLTRRLSLFDSLFFLALFVAYGIRVSREELSEPELLGVAEKLASLPRGRRMATVSGLFLCAAAFILAAAEPFAESLVSAGKSLGIDEFLLVQWIAPLASEGPEMIVAAILAWRANSNAAIGTLLSSKVNQWTLLVGSIPLAYAVGGGGLFMEMDARQNEEFFLTAAQTVLGIAIFIDLEFRPHETVMLLLLFLLQFPFPQQEVRIGFSVAYLVIAAFILITRRDQIKKVFRSLRA